jgi:DNA-binding GntR family transcriptional regulator
MTHPAAGGDWHLDRSSAIPAYAQIEQRLSRLIESGALPVGERVPSERELAGLAGVSRLTARAALDSLARRGLLDRGVGRRGTVVSSSKLTLDLTDFGGFTEMLGRHGIRATARVQSLAELAAGDEVAAALAIEPGEGVYRVRRLRLADGEPLALEDSWIPAGRFPGLLELDLRGSLYRLMRDRYGVAPVHAAQRLEPVLAEPEQAQALGTAPGSPLMLVRRIASSREDGPVEFALDLLRGDRARFVVEVNTSAAAAGPRRGNMSGTPI